MRRSVCKRGFISLTVLALTCLWPASARAQDGDVWYSYGCSAWMEEWSGSLHMKVELEASTKLTELCAPPYT